MKTEQIRSLAAGLTIAAFGLILSLPSMVQGSALNRIYTEDADFAEGTLLNVNHTEVPNQLQLDFDVEPFPFIWVACSARGTVVRIDVNTGAILGEYSTAPAGRGLNPSRTTVDQNGNVWVGNRNEREDIGGVLTGSAVKIGLVIGGTRVDADGTPNPAGQYLMPPFAYSTAEDRDGDGLIKTSNGLGNILPWSDITDGSGGGAAGGPALVEDAEDECLLVYQRLPDVPGTRHISVDAGNDVWVGGYDSSTQHMFLKLSGSDGSKLDSFDARLFGAGGYGGFIDANNVLWSASLGQSKLLRFDLTTKTGMGIAVPLSYGLGLDGSGSVWNSMWTNGTIMKVTSAGAIVPGFPKPVPSGSNCRGVAVTPADNNVWVANSGGASVGRLDNAGIQLATIPVGTTPTGVAVDANGKVWVTNFGSDSAMRISPATNVVELTVDLGAGAGPYNYSDMTGSLLLNVVQTGRWTVIHDSGELGTEWGTVSWISDVPSGTSLSVGVRAADNGASLSLMPWTTVASGVPFCELGIAGQLVEIGTFFGRAGSTTNTPVLFDLEVEACNQPPDCSNALADIGSIWPPNHKWVPVEILGVTDPDGDPVTITIDSIHQDEPVDSYGDGRFAPDGMGVGSSVAEVRAERAASRKGPRNGRVYHIGFTAEDGRGGYCSGEVLVGVPHSVKSTPVDDGSLYDSTTP